MKALKLCFVVAFTLSAMTISAQEKAKEKTSKAQITGEDLLGLKSGADPKKANAGVAGSSRKKVVQLFL
jgi:hypothetical protein